jgi:predicted small secreted protein
MNTHYLSSCSRVRRSFVDRLLFILAITFVLAAAGCKHTAHGVGEDMEAAGEKIQEKTK